MVAAIFVSLGKSLFFAREVLSYSFFVCYWLDLLLEGVLLELV